MKTSQLTVEFTGWLVESGRSERTVEAYDQDVRSFIAWWEGVYQEKFEAWRVISKDLRDYRRAAIAAKVAPATWNRRLATLTLWARFLGHEELMEGVEPLDEVELPPRWLDDGEYKRFVRVVEMAINGAGTEARRRAALRDGAMIGLMVWAGLREGEVCGLELGDVDLRERSGKVVVRQGKGDKRREVPLCGEARRFIGKWLSVRGSESGPLFDGLVTRTVQRRVAEVGRIAGLVITPHDLRHTFAKRMLDRGVPLTTVSKLLGHARLDVTARYVQPGWKDFEAAVEGV